MLSTSAYSPRCVASLVRVAGLTHGDLRKHNFLPDCPSHFLKSNTDPRWRKHLTNWDPRHNSLATDQESLRAKSAPSEETAATRNVDQSWEHFRLSWIIDREFQTKKCGLIRMLAEYLMSPPHGLWMGKCDSKLSRHWQVHDNTSHILTEKDVRFLCTGQILRGKLSCRRLHFFECCHNSWNDEAVGESKIESRLEN